MASASAARSCPWRAQRWPAGRTGSSSRSTPIRTGRSPKARSLEFPEDDEPTFVPPDRPKGSAPLPGRDVDMGPDDALVLGQGLRGLREPVSHLDCGNSGTTLRLLTGICAGAGLEATLTG